MGHGNRHFGHVTNQIGTCTAHLWWKDIMCIQHNYTAQRAGKARPWVRDTDRGTVAVWHRSDCPNSDRYIWRDSNRNAQPSVEDGLRVVCSARKRQDFHCIMYINRCFWNGDFRQIPWKQWSERDGSYKWWSQRIIIIYIFHSGARGAQNPSGAWCVNYLFGKRRSSK